jgi:hypothetical protein
LFVPFVFGCLFIIPPQIYFERLTQGGVYNGYFDFWPANFAGGMPYPQGDISWHHLWFILYLFIFSLLLAPLFAWLKKHPGCGLVRMTKALARHRFGLDALALPLLALQLTLADKFPNNNGLVNDWFNLAHSCTLFFLGFLMLTSGDGFWNNVTRGRWIYLGLGVAGFTLLMSGWEVWGDFPLKGVFINFVRTLNMWSWILAIFGFGAVVFTRPSRALTYANEAVYPFFILHQTVMMGLCYYMMDVDMAFWPKFAILSVGTFGGCLIVYELCIRRWKVMRFLFGMKNNS